MLLVVSAALESLLRSRRLAAQAVALKSPPHRDLSALAPGGPGGCLGRTVSSVGRLPRILLVGAVVGSNVLWPRWPSVAWFSGPSLSYDCPSPNASGQTSNAYVQYYN